MSANPKIAFVSAESYLQDELNSPIKHQYIDGQVYAMAGASRNHERIAGNVYRKMGNHLEGRSCEAFASDLKVKVGNNFFYPDALVVCGEQNPHEYYTTSPTIIVEVLSKSTRRMDQTTKRLAYFNITTLQEYIVIEQDIVDVEVCRRSNHWVSEHFFMGDEVCFAAIGLTLTVEDIYARVENDDVKTFREEQHRAANSDTETAST
ncbi:MAG: Uma2 family endonuclease [Candidatus Methylumidiphilus sp.]